MIEYGPLLQISANVLAIFAGIYAIVHRVKKYFGDAQVERAAQITQIGSDMKALLDTHEAKDAERHSENVERFGEMGERITRVETVLNGHSRRRKRN